MTLSAADKHPDPSPETVGTSASGIIRPFRAEDAPRVAELLLWAFQRSTRAPSQAMIDYIRRLYLDIPWADQDIYARVMELPDGRLSSFGGMTPLPLRMGDKRLKVAVTSSLAVDERISDPLTGSRMLRHMRSGKQDGLFSDRSSDAATAMARQLKCEVLHAYSADFIRVLRPAGRGVEWLARKFAPARVLAPIVRPLDRRLASRSLLSGESQWAAPGPTRGIQQFRDVPVTVEEIADLLPPFLERYTLRPDFTRHDWQFILEDASQKRDLGDFVANSVVAPGGDTVGLYLYHVREGRTAHLLQAFALPGREGVVLDKVIADAMERGAVALAGRATPTFHRQLLERYAFIVPNLWALVQAHDPEVMQHFHAGTAFFTGLVGENWIRLNGDKFQ